jgi:mRNA-degrading endonuclease RelE of RelBE toxin-antitoxin system
LVFQNFERLVPEPLSGVFKGAYKPQVGDWQVVYTVEGKVIVIQSIAHCRKIYKSGNKT